MNSTKKALDSKFLCGGMRIRDGVRAGGFSLALLLCSLGVHAQQPARVAQVPSAISIPQETQAAPATQQADPQTPGRISGKVVDPKGAPVTGATVKLMGEASAANQETQSDDDGVFSFENVPAGSFKLTITAEGFAAKSVEGALKFGENNTVPPIELAIATAVTEVRVVPQSQVEIAEEQIKQQEKQRPLGFIPNFYVSYVPDAAPLNTRQKFELAGKTLVDPITFVLVGAAAGLQQADDQFSGYGQGAQGYAKRYGASYADTVTGVLLGSALLPSLLKQDPRYFYKGTGSKKSRVLYALANSVICKGDDGNWQANYSAILGGLAAGGISNAYYPAKDRGAALTFENTAIGIGTTAVANLFQEFVVKKFTPNMVSNGAGNGTKLPGALSKMLGTFVHEGD